MSSPAFAEVRRTFPEHRILLLTIQSADKSQQNKVANYAGDTNSMPWVELARPHLIDEVIALKSTTDFCYLWGLRQHLSAYHIEKAILMTDVWAPLRGRCMKMLLLQLLIGPVPVLGWRGVSSAGQLKKMGELKHHVHGPLQFLSEMVPPKAYKDENLVFDLRPGQEANDWASYWLQEHDLISGKRLLAVAPGSIQPHKRWPIKSFKKLIESILVQYVDIQVIVLGTSTDKTLGDELVAIAKARVFNLAGVTSIAQSAALLQRCTLLVGNDGGAMHLGDAMGCKVVSIVPGIEYPDSIEPWHNKALAVRHPVECSPCYNFVTCPQGHNHCMTELPIELVLERCISVLEQ
jgi:heptosyltransferase-2